jgi:small subunit ribosomal protein S17
MEKTSQQQQMTGLVVSDKMDKTVVVAVSVQKRHPKYHKAYTRTYRYKAHDEANAYHVGDKVIIGSVRPLSKDKHYTVLSKA